VATELGELAQALVETPIASKSPHEVHMARAERGTQHTKPKPQRGPQPGTHAQKHPKDEAGKFRHK